MDNLSALMYIQKGIAKKESQKEPINNNNNNNNNNEKNNNENNKQNRKKKTKKEKPWQSRLEEILEKTTPNGQKSRFLKKAMANTYASMEHKANNENRDMLKKIFDVYRYCFAYVVGGATYDKIATEVETITGVSKKHAQDVNAIAGILLNIPYVWSYYAVGNAVSNHGGKWTLFFTLSTAAINTAWNTYRLLKRDKKARLSIGTEALILNGIIYASRKFPKKKEYTSSFNAEAN